MTVRPRSRPVAWWRWAVVVLGVAVLCCVPAVVAALPVSVPAVSVAQLRDAILASQRLSFDGYAESDAEFGLPSFSAFSGTIALLDGVTRMRVWQASPDRWRVDTLTDTGENDTYEADNQTSFVWDSGEQLLTGIFGRQSVRLPRASDLTPQALSVRIINEAGSGASLHPLAARRVAGQAAAGLAVIPAGKQSTIGQVDIWASPATGIPLLVEVFGRGATIPALTSQFLQVGLWKPQQSVLDPQEGPGTGFTGTTPASFSQVLRNLDDEVLPHTLGGLTRQPSPPGFSQIGVYGHGLATFAVLTFRRNTGGSLVPTALADGAAQLSFTDGTGAVATAPLISLALVHPYRSPDTFLLVGLVNKETLERAATVLAAKPDQDIGE